MLVNYSEDGLLFVRLVVNAPDDRSLRKPNQVDVWLVIACGCDLRNNHCPLIRLCVENLYPDLIHGKVSDRCQGDAGSRYFVAGHFQYRGNFANK
jgi:hypothetical protein